MTTVRKSIDDIVLRNVPPEAGMPVCLALKLKSGEYREEDQASNVISKLDCLDELETELARQGMQPLSQFVFHDIELLEEMVECAPDEAREDLHTRLERARQQPEWHDPQAGLTSVGRMIELLRARSLPTDAISLPLEAIRDLESFQRVLSDAVNSGDQFRLIVA